MRDAAFSLSAWQASLTEDVLRILDFVFSGDGVLDRALEALDNGAVSRLRCPAGQVVYQVQNTAFRGQHVDTNNGDG